MFTIIDAHRDGALYARIWEHLDARGLRQDPPEVLRERIAEAAGVAKK
jgi:hypothetical protein